MDEYMDSYRKQREGEAKAYEENVADHQHEFSFDGIDGFVCMHANCNEWIDMDEVEKRLNATKWLSVQVAQEEIVHTSDRTSADSS